MTTIGIIEDDKAIREGLRTFLNRQPDFSCVIVTESVEEYIEICKNRLPPNILLLDIGLPGISGIDGLRVLQKLYADTKIIMSTGNEESTYIFRSFNAGAKGYLLKTNVFMEVCTAINSVAEGNAYLSPVVTRKVLNFFDSPASGADDAGITERERQIVRCLVDGLSYKLIAAQLNISLDTVRFHLKNLYKKLRVNSKSEVISKALKSGILTT